VGAGEGAAGLVAPALPERRGARQEGAPPAAAGQKRTVRSRRS
jgi:hypothetical protein